MLKNSCISNLLATSLLFYCYYRLIIAKILINISYFQWQHFVKSTVMFLMNRITLVLMSVQYIISHPYQAHSFLFKHSIYISVIVIQHTILGAYSNTLHDCRYLQVRCNNVWWATKQSLIISLQWGRMAFLQVLGKEGQVTPVCTSDLGRTIWSPMGIPVPLAGSWTLNATKRMNS